MNWAHRRLTIHHIALTLCAKDPTIGGWRALLWAAKTYEERYYKCATSCSTLKP